MSTKHIGWLIVAIMVTAAPMTLGEDAPSASGPLGKCDHATKICEETDFAAADVKRVTGGAVAPTQGVSSDTSFGDEIGDSSQIHFRERNKDLDTAVHLLANAGFHIAAWTTVGQDGNLTVEYEAGLNASAKGKVWHAFGNDRLTHDINRTEGGNASTTTGDTNEQNETEPAVPCRDPRGCPDLIVDISKLLLEKAVVTETFAEENCNVAEGSTQAGTRSLLRFTFGSPNIGDGDLIVGAPSHNPDWFEWGDCHGHWHFREYADYRMWTPEGYLQWQAARAQQPDALADDVLAQHPELQDELVAGHKQGFCVIDIDWWHPLAGQRYTSCSSNQGISTGWMDVYYMSLDGQFIDVTDVPFGAYVLETEVNPARFYAEKDYSNNSAAVLVALGSPSLPPISVPPDLPPVLE